MFSAKIEQFHDMVRCRKEYRNAQKNCEGAMWYITDAAETRYRNPTDTHQDKGCIFKNIGITVDGQCVPDGTYEEGTEYCEFFDWDNPCHKKTCKYQLQNSAAIENIRDCEMAREKLRVARRRFWGLEK